MPHPSKHGAPASSSLPTPIIILLVIAAVILAFGVGYSQYKPRTAQSFSERVSAMSSSADSQLFVVGTLAPLGSFDYRTAPILTHLAVLDRHADGSLVRGQITHDQAAEVLAKGDSVDAVIEQATRICDPAPHSGKCRGDRRKAEGLLAIAERQLAQIHDYVPSR